MRTNCLALWIALVASGCAESHCRMTEFESSSNAEKAEALRKSTLNEEGVATKIAKGVIQAGDAFEKHLTKKTEFESCIDFISENRCNKEDKIDSDCVAKVKGEERSIAQTRYIAEKVFGTSALYWFATVLIILRLSWRKITPEKWSAWSSGQRLWESTRLFLMAYAFVLLIRVTTVGPWLAGATIGVMLIGFGWLIFSDHKSQSVPMSLPQAAEAQLPTPCPHCGGNCGAICAVSGTPGDEPVKPISPPEDEDPLGKLMG